MTHPLTQYYDMLKILDEDADMRNDVYDELMRKEKEVLNVVNRVANQKDSPSLLTFPNISVTEGIARFSFTWKNIITELIDSRGKDTFIILLKDDRKVYVGLMIIILAFFIFFMSVSE